MPIAKENCSKHHRSEAGRSSSTQRSLALGNNERAKQQFFEEWTVGPDQRHDDQITDQIAFDEVKAPAGTDIREELPDNLQQSKKL